MGGCPFALTGRGHLEFLTNLSPGYAEGPSTGDVRNEEKYCVIK